MVEICQRNSEEASNPPLLGNRSRATCEDNFYGREVLYMSPTRHKVIHPTKYKVIHKGLEKLVVRKPLLPRSRDVVNRAGRFRSEYKA